MRSELTRFRRGERDQLFERGHEKTDGRREERADAMRLPLESLKDRRARLSGRRK